jgi:hypothetical protein
MYGQSLSLRSATISLASAPQAMIKQRCTA